MKKIMFSDQFGLTELVLTNKKTMTLRPSVRYGVGEVVAIARPYSDIFSASDIFIRPTPGWSNKMFVRSHLMPNRIKITDLALCYLADLDEQDFLKGGVIRHGDRFALNSPLFRFRKTYATARDAYTDMFNKLSPGSQDKRLIRYDFELVC